MNLSDADKVLIVAVLCFAAAFVMYLFGLPAADELPLEHVSEPWSVYDYVTLGLLMLGVGSIFACVWLYRAEDNKSELDVN